MLKNINSVDVFSNRVENYSKYRPSYPISILEFCKEELKIKSSDIIADIGSGTGLFSELFLKNGNIVFCIEPNKKMRNVAERTFEDYPNFESINAKAEETSLPDKTIDVITVAQAFHWFDIQKTRKEFLRILKPNAYVILIWNERKINTEFSLAYEKFILEFAINYEKISYRNVINKSILSSFWGDNICSMVTFDNYQIFNFESLKGRVLSSSYIPTETHPQYNKMIESLKKIFLEFQIDKQVKFEYTTKVYFGKIT